MMTITNQKALQQCIQEYVGPKDQLAAEIIATFRMDEGKSAWANRPFVQRARKRGASEAPAVDPRQMPLPGK